MGCPKRGSFGIISRVKKNAQKRCPGNVSVSRRGERVLSSACNGLRGDDHGHFQGIVKAL